MYRVVANRVWTNAEGWNRSEQIPTFYLDVGSIADACAIVRAVVVPYDRKEVSIHGGIVDDATGEYLSI